MSKDLNVRSVENIIVEEKVKAETYRTISSKKVVIRTSVKIPTSKIEDMTIGQLKKIKQSIKNQLEDSTAIRDFLLDNISAPDGVPVKVKVSVSNW